MLTEPLYEYRKITITLTDDTGLCLGMATVATARDKAPVVHTMRAEGRLADIMAALDRVSGVLAGVLQSQAAETAPVLWKEQPAAP